MLPLFLTLLLAPFILASSSDNPFCGPCRCVSGQAGVSVLCEGKDNIKTLLFSNATWSDNGTPRQFLSVVITKSKLEKLDQEFPKADVLSLELSNDGIKSLGQSVFKNLQKMTSLVLSGNEIEDIDREAFRGQYMEEQLMPLRSLTSLDLSHNKIHTLNSNVFEHTTGIEELNLSYNPIKMIDHSTQIAITSLTYIKKLDLSYTQISTLPATFLHTPAHLEFLSLEGNEFEAIPTTLNEAQRLTTLILNRNPIVNLTAKTGFPVVKSLKIIHLCHMPALSMVGNGSLAGLINLKALYLAENPNLTQIEDNALCNQDESDKVLCSELDALYLNDNHLSYLNKPFIGRWDKLKHLSMLGNPWICDCKNQWFVDELMPIYAELNSIEARALKCAAPVEMKADTFYELSIKHSMLRCLDIFGNRPERDGMVLVILLAVLLTGIPLILAIIYAYQQNWFGLCDKSAASYSRRYYSRTNQDYF